MRNFIVIYFKIYWFLVYVHFLSAIWIPDPSDQISKGFFYKIGLRIV